VEGILYIGHAAIHDVTNIYIFLMQVEGQNFHGLIHQAGEFAQISNVSLSMSLDGSEPQYPKSNLMGSRGTNTECPKSRFTEILSCDYQKMSYVH
jgi:hypothetical protein